MSYSVIVCPFHFYTLCAKNHISSLSAHVIFGHCLGLSFFPLIVFMCHISSLSAHVIFFLLGTRVIFPHCPRMSFFLIKCTCHICSLPVYVIFANCLRVSYSLIVRFVKFSHCLRMSYLRIVFVCRICSLSAFVIFIDDRLGGYEAYYPVQNLRKMPLGFKQIHFTCIGKHVITNYTNCSQFCFLGNAHLYLTRMNSHKVTSDPGNRTQNALPPFMYTTNKLSLP